MKKQFFLILILLLLFSSNLSKASDNYPFSVGVGLMAKSGINVASVPDGLQNAFSIYEGVDIAALLYLPMSDDTRTGVLLEAAYTNVPFGLKYYGDPKYNGNAVQRWLNISVSVMLSGVIVGLDFGFDAFKDKYDVFFDNTQTVPLSKNDFNANLKVGGIVPVYESQLGCLNFYIMGTYNITGIDYRGDYTYNPVTLGLGLNYLFNLEGF